MTHRIARLRSVSAAAVGLSVLLAGCGEGSTGGQPATTSSSSATTSSTSSTTSPTTPPAATPSTTRSTPDTTLSTPPPAHDPKPVPDNPQAYAKAFVAAWVDHDKGRAEQLGSRAAVKAIFATRAPSAPAFTGCEGAAGSSYCTWEGTEYTVLVRVQNAAASAKELHAVSEAKVSH